MASLEAGDEDKDLDTFRPFLQDDVLCEQRSDKVPNRSLSNLMPLPKYLRANFPRHLIGRVLREIDPFYFGKDTFVVIGSDWTIHRFSSKKVFWFLSPFHPLRWFFIRIITHCVFRYFILLISLVVITVCILVASGIWVKTLHKVSLALAIIFFLEMIIKIVAYGFLLHPFSYLRNHWNWYDFIANVLIWPIYLGAAALRCFKIIHHFTYSRVTFSWIFRSLISMKDLLFFHVFLYIIFTFFAMGRFGRLLQHSCKPDNNYEEWMKNLCGTHSLARHCPGNNTCLIREHYRPPTSFDSFPEAGFQITRLMARDYWEELFVLVSATDGPTELMFFLTVIVYGGYYMVNLFVAYLAVSLASLLGILEGKEPRKVSKKIQMTVVNAEKQSDAIKDEDDKTISEKEPANPDELDDLKVVEQQPIFQEIQFQTTDDGGHVAFNNADPQSTTSRNGSSNEKYDGEKTIAVAPEADPIKKLWTAFVDSFWEWKQCCSCFTTLQKTLYKIVVSNYFTIFIASCIILNTVFLATVHYPMSNKFADALRFTFLIFSFIFVLEAILKILALSPKHYFKESLNVLDFFIALMCLAHLFNNIPPGIIVLRSIRLLRILSLARWWPQFNHLIKINQTNSLIVCVLSILCALIGRFFFATIYDDRRFMGPKYEKPQWHFDDFLHSLMVVIKIMCGEWIETYSEVTRRNQYLFGLVSVPQLFYPFCIILGNFAIYTIFITLVMAALHSHDLCETTLYEDRNLLVILRNLFQKMCSSRSSPQKLEKRPDHKSEEKLCELSADEETPHTPSSVDTLPLCCWENCYRYMPCFGSPTAASTDRTPFWIKWENGRRSVLIFVNNMYFNIALNVFILISTIPLCWKDMYYDEYATSLQKITEVTDVAVLIILTLDIFLRILGNGCKKYFSDAWSIIDFTITLLHLSAIFAEMNSVYAFPYAFRLLKLVPRMQHLRVLVAAIFYKIHVLGDALLACSMLWIIFIIFGIEMFGGNFNYCADSNNTSLQFNKTIYKNDCIEIDYDRIPRRINYDNFANAILPLLQVATSKGWIPIIHGIVESTGIDVYPVTDYSYYLSFYFILFLIFGVLWSFALIIAAFILKTNEQRKQIMGGYIEILMSDNQRQAYAAKKSTFFISPIKVVPKPTSRLLLFFYKLVESPKFNVVIVLLILGNILSQALWSVMHYNYAAQTIVSAFNDIFNCFFTLEVLFRIAAYRQHYFKSPWNIYDFLLLLASNLGHFAMFFVNVDFAWFFTLLRIVRLVRWFKPVRRIAFHIVVLNGALHNIAYLLFILAVTYSLIAMASYGHVPYNHFHAKLFNFRTFLSSFLLVIQVTFEAGWNDVYEQIANENGSAAFIVSCVLLNIFIFIECGTVLLLEYYQQIQEKARLGITDYHLENFAEVWKAYDPEATGFIAYDHLSVFLSMLVKPWHVPVARYTEVMSTMDIPIYKDDRLAFKDVLLALVASRDKEGKFARPRVPTSSGDEEAISSTQSRLQQPA